MHFLVRKCGGKRENQVERRTVLLIQLDSLLIEMYSFTQTQ